LAAVRWPVDPGGVGGAEGGREGRHDLVDAEGLCLLGGQLGLGGRGRQGHRPGRAGAGGARLQHGGGGLAGDDLEASQSREDADAGAGRLEPGVLGLGVGEAGLAAQEAVQPTGVEAQAQLAGGGLGADQRGQVGRAQVGPAGAGGHRDRRPE
jgi:hypothetical protein